MFRLVLQVLHPLSVHEYSFYFYYIVGGILFILGMLLQYDLIPGDVKWLKEVFGWIFVRVGFIMLVFKSIYSYANFGRLLGPKKAFAYQGGPTDKQFRRRRRRRPRRPLRSSHAQQYIPYQPQPPQPQPHVQQYIPYQPHHQPQPPQPSAPSYQPQQPQQLHQNY